MVRSLLFCVTCIVIAALLVVPAQGQTSDRAVVAGTLIEDRDGDGTLSPADGGARTLVQLMQRSADGGYKCRSEQRTDEAGKFRFEDLSIADYELVVRWDPGFLDYPDAGGNLTITGSADDLRDGIETHFVRLKKFPDGMVPFGPSNPSQGVAVACEGLDNPQVPQNICQVTGPDTYIGPREVDFDVGSLGVSLLAGTFRIWLSPPPSEPAMVVCYVEGNSSVTLRIADAREIRREVNSPQGVAVVDAIVASVKKISEAGRPREETPPPLVMPIRPPDTGSAGLR